MQSKGEHRQRANALFSKIFFDKSESLSQPAEDVNALYGAVTVIVDYSSFWLRRYRSCSFDVKYAPWC